MQMGNRNTLIALRQAIWGVALAFLVAQSVFALAPSEEIERLRGELDELRLRYTDRHPDVVQLLRQIERVQAEHSAPVQKGDVDVTSATQTTYFKFRKTGTLVKRPEGMPKPGPYWPTLVSMQDVADFPFDYALYFSTDHHRGKGGIWLYVCSGIPSDPACWRSYDDAVASGAFDHIPTKPKKNPVFVDTIQGNQTETPHANVIDGIVYMTYHNNGAGHHQSTLLATSPDGVNFNRINGDADSVILDYDPKTAPGNGHTGYFRWGPNPFSGVQYRYVGYSLHGGGRRPGSAMWGSDDVVQWKLLGFLSLPRGYAPALGDRLFSHIDPNSITKINENRYGAITSGGTPRHGKTKRSARLYEVYLSADGLAINDTPRLLLALGNPTEADGLMAFQPNSVTRGETWYLLYTAVSETARENTLMGAVGFLSPR